MTKAKRDASLQEQLANVSIKGQLQDDHDLMNATTEAGQDARAEHAEESKPLSPEHVEDVIDGIMTAAYSAFREPEVRILGNNGKAYPLDYDFEARGDVENTGELVTVDKYGFLNKAFAKTVCSGLEMLLRNQEQSIARQQDSIRKELYFGHSRGIDVAAKVERMADFLGAMQDQAAFLRIALTRAIEGFKALTGEVHLTREQRDRVVASRRTEIAADDALSAKLAKLGVKLD